MNTWDAGFDDGANWCKCMIKDAIDAITSECEENDVLHKFLDMLEDEMEKIK